MQITFGSLSFFCGTKIHLGGEEDAANEAKGFVDGELGHLAVESSVLK